MHAELATATAHKAQNSEPLGLQVKEGGVGGLRFYGFRVQGVGELNF